MSGMEDISEKCIELTALLEPLFVIDFAPSIVVYFYMLTFTEKLIIFSSLSIGFLIILNMSPSDNTTGGDNNHLGSEIDPSDVISTNGQEGAAGELAPPFDPSILNLEGGPLIELMFGSRPLDYYKGAVYAYFLSELPFYSNVVLRQVEAISNIYGNFLCIKTLTGLPAEEQKIYFLSHYSEVHASLHEIFHTILNNKSWLVYFINYDNVLNVLMELMKLIP